MADPVVRVTQFTDDAWSSLELAGALAKVHDAVGRCTLETVLSGGPDASTVRGRYESAWADGARLAKEAKKVMRTPKGLAVRFIDRMPRMGEFFRAEQWHEVATRDLSILYTQNTESPAAGYALARYLKLITRANDMAFTGASSTEMTQILQCILRLVGSCPSAWHANGFVTNAVLENLADVYKMLALAPLLHLDLPAATTREMIDVANECVHRIGAVVQHPQFHVAMFCFCTHEKTLPVVARAVAALYACATPPPGFGAIELCGLGVYETVREMHDHEDKYPSMRNKWVYDFVRQCVNEECMAGGIPVLFLPPHAQAKVYMITEAARLGPEDSELHAVDAFSEADVQYMWANLTALYGVRGALDYYGGLMDAVVATGTSLSHSSLVFLVYMWMQFTTTVPSTSDPLKPPIALVTAQTLAPKMCDIFEGIEPADAVAVIHAHFTVAPA